MLKRCILFGLCLGLLASPITGCDDNSKKDQGQEQGGQEQGGQEQGGQEQGGQEQGGQEQGGQEQGDKELKVNVVKSEKKYAKADIDGAALDTLVKGQYDLNFELLAKSESQIENKNAMISTFSIQSALGMTWAGAAEMTADEMKKVLHFDDNTHKGLNKIRAEILDGQMEAVDKGYEKAESVEVGINNDIYISPKYTWAADWLDVLSVNYDAGVTEMNFAADVEGATKYINDAVSKDTHNRINNLIPNGVITKDTQLVLTNAIYFKAPWDFIEFEDSKETKFKLLDGSNVKATFITASDHYMYAETAEYQAVSLPLRGKHFAMLFVLPATNGYDKLASSLNGEKVDGIFKGLSSKQVDVTLPTFTFETGLELVEPLKSLGMQQAFTDAANFSAMTEGENMLYISAILHKSFIGLDKKGIEASAASAVVAADNAISLPEDPVVIDINRPFFFVVYETETKSPMFVGRVLNPSEN